jgi:creatinine amidohydrolase
VRGGQAVKYRYDEMTWLDVREAAQADPVVVIPIGTTEQHGYHLPLMVDSLCATAVSQEAVERAFPSAMLLPCVCYAFNENQMDFPGTISVDTHVIIDYMACVGLSLARHGFRHILFVNGHGSNTPFLDAAARRVVNESEALCAVVTWWNLLTPEDLKWRESKFPGGMGHACELETSMLLHLRPDLVDMSKAVDEIAPPMSDHFVFDLTSGGPVSLADHSSRHSAIGVLGQPTLASAEKGAAALQAAAQGLVSVIEEFRSRKILPRRNLHDAKTFPKI